MRLLLRQSLLLLGLAFLPAVGQALYFRDHVSWQANEDPKPKTIVAKAGKGVTIKNLEVTSSTPDFTTKVEPGSATGEFRIIVSPKDTGHQATANLTIKPDSSAGPAKVFNASARVMPPVPAAQSS